MHNLESYSKNIQIQQLFWDIGSMFNSGSVHDVLTRVVKFCEVEDIDNFNTGRALQFCQVWWCIPAFLRLTFDKAKVLGQIKKDVREEDMLAPDRIIEVTMAFDANGEDYMSLLHIPQSGALFHAQGVQFNWKRL